MIVRFSAAAFCAFLANAAMVQGQTNPQDPGYVPGVTFQTTNPNYPARNPFYFEGRIDWNLLQITTPSNAWEYVQRGIHEQDDLLDTTDAISDYQQAISMNNLSNGTCQLITTAAGLGASTNPPPCMFTVRLRLANLLIPSAPSSAVELLQEVLNIDPLRLGVNAIIGQAYSAIAAATADPVAQAAAWNNAIAAYKAELALSPVTASTAALTGDLANNAHVHWALAEIYRQTGQTANETSELTLYLQATQWHSDTYAWHIQLASVRLAALQRTLNEGSRRDRR